MLNVKRKRLSTLKVAITGANGFLGSYLVKECLFEGMEVIALIRKNANTDLLPTDERLHVENVDYKSGNLSNQFQKLKSTYGEIDFFIHNAGLTVSIFDEEYYEVNVGLAEKILAALSKSSLLRKDGKLVYVSSYAANGPAGIGHPVSHYGRSKKQAEEVIEKSNFQYLFIRPTGIYGAGDVAFLPLFKTAKKGLYPLTSSAQRMTMIHAKDLARMIVFETKNSTGIIHCNDGETYFHKDFIKIFEGLFKRKVRTFPMPGWIVRVSIGASDTWHKITKKRPNITVEKFEEISQHWDLHTTDLKHSTLKAEISLQDGFEDALNYYKEKNLI